MSDTASQPATKVADGREGFVDLQVNGYAGVDFNADDLSPEDLHTACEALASGGVASFCPTIITETTERMTARLRRLVELAAADPLAERMVAGLHIEGPLLNPGRGYIGAHPAAPAKAATGDIVRRLVDACEGHARIVTLAPERCDASLVRDLVARGVLVAAGHTDATGDDLDRAIDAGLSMVTHLGNGCPHVLPRHDNILQRVLSRRDALRVTLIADGIHLPPETLTNFLRDLPHVAIVSDATAATSLGPGRYSLGGQPVVVDETLAAWSDDRTHLVGSAAPLSHAAGVLRDVGCSAQTVASLLSHRPAAWLREAEAT